MPSRTIVAFCITDDALQAMGHKDDPQAKVPSSVILALATLAAMELGGKHNRALALAKDLNLFTHVPSPSRFNRRLHALYPLFLPLLPGLEEPPPGPGLRLGHLPPPRLREHPRTPLPTLPPQGLPRLRPQQAGLLPRPQAPPPGGRREVRPRGEPEPGKLA